MVGHTLAAIVTVTLLLPEKPSESRRERSTLPPDLLEQVRGRVQLLALILIVAFAFEPVTYGIFWLLAHLIGKQLPANSSMRLGFQAISVGALAVSCGLWWIARKRVVTARTLLTLSLVYEVVICFVISMLTFWQYYLQTGILPNLTWVIGVITLFPLIMPGPPRQMLAAALIAAATSPLALFILDRLGKVPAANGYVEAFIPPLFSALFAYMGARVVYGLGREVAAARELGSYRLEEQLGQGGMGEVWRARHRLLARPAAIKLIRPTVLVDGQSGVSESLMRRFEQEARAIAQLRSPHTVELFDFGVADNGAFYFVMELLEGLDADKLVRRYGPIPAERVIYLLRQVCHSLSEAQACGLVHRDIKPANIFLCRYGEDVDFVKVLDFGLVKARSERVVAAPALTQENTVQGTPAYMAPEQALGESALDGRADIYAAGCVAFWLLTGQTVFSSDTAMGLVLQHIQATPTAPSRRTSLPIPPDLDALVLSCLAKDPAHRPQSARELLDRLARIDGANSWTDERAHEWWTTHQPDGSAPTAGGLS